MQRQDNSMIYRYFYPKKKIPSVIDNKMIVAIVPNAAVELSKKLSGMISYFRSKVEKKSICYNLQV